MLFIAVITVSGILGTLLPVYQDRAGHRRMTLFLLSVWVVTTGGFALYAYLREASWAGRAWVHSPRGRCGGSGTCSDSGSAPSARPTGRSSDTSHPPDGRGDLRIVGHGLQTVPRS